MGNRASSNSSEGNDGFDPSALYIYRGRGSVPRNARRVEVDRSVKFIPERLFVGCDQLESVLLHEGLLRIGDWAFDRCSSLRSIHIPSTVAEIGEGAFHSCSRLAAVEFPPGLESIEEWTFAHCTSLVKVRIPASVARIGVCAFMGCTNLASLGLREGLRMIEDSAFRDCRSLESLDIPSSVDEIGVGAFWGCSSLSLLRLHERLPKMEGFAFAGCTSLESIRFVRLSKRMEAMRMDDQATPMIQSRLNEITNAMTRSYYDYDDWEAAGDIWGKCKRSLERAYMFLEYLELKGAMSVLELALWKAKIDDEGDDRPRGDPADDEDGGGDAKDAARARKRHLGNPPSREDCRFKCGAGIVSAEVRKFFAYKTNWPGLDDSE